MITMATIWAINFSVVRYATRHFDPIVFTTLRVAASALLLGIIVFLRDPPKLSRGTWLRLLLLGMAGHAVYQLFFVGGLARTSVANAALIISAAPAFIAVASMVRGTERVRRMTFAGIALSIIGVGLVFAGTTSTSGARSTTVLGAVLIFAAVLAWTVFSVGLQPLSASVDGLHISAITLIGGAVPLLIVTMPSLLHQNWSTPGRGGWMALGYASAISTLVGYGLWYHGLRVLGATRTSVYTNLQPIIAIGIAWMFLGEVPTPWQAVGAATIVSGIFLTRA